MRILGSGMSARSLLLGKMWRSNGHEMEAAKLLGV